MNDKTKYWLEIAEYDLDTARAMLDTGRYLHIGFMCHQVVEKALKAAIANAGQDPPYITNLSRLCELSGMSARLSADQRSLLDTLESLRNQGQYPEDKDQLLKELTAERCEQLLDQTDDLLRLVRAAL